MALLHCQLVAVKMDVKMYLDKCTGFMSASLLCSFILNVNISIGYHIIDIYRCITNIGLPTYSTCCASAHHSKCRCANVCYTPINVKNMITNTYIYILYKLT